MMGDEIEHLRWLAVVTYRSEAGPLEVDHHFEELEELHADRARAALRYDREHRRHL
jgi:hypothetical protein